MGDVFGNALGEEVQAHSVCVSDFYIGKYEVTQSQWVQMMAHNPARFITCGNNCPVEKVSWHDVQAFITKFNAATGQSYRLPTEAEWEYAARSGGKKEEWSGVNDSKQIADFVWFASNAEGRTHTVGMKKPNGLGLYDMSGNVAEWCQDWYASNYYLKSPRQDPQGPTPGKYRVVRGGAWGHTVFKTSSVYRDWSFPYSKDYGTGFRLAFSLKSP